MQQQPSAVYVVPQTQPQVPIMPPHFGKNSIRMTCPHCHTEIQTKVEHESTKKTHLAALGLCCGLSLFLCCCFAPVIYLFDDVKAKKHSCPKCQAFLGMYDKILGAF